MSLFSPIHHTFAPHVDLRFLMQSLGLLMKPWTWRNGNATALLSQKLGEQFGGETQLFASGRQALLACLQSLEIQSGDEVIVQGYTCVAVCNAITAAGGKPIYVDIDQDTLNMTPDTVEQAITNQTRAVICQHTFGIPSNGGALKELCEQYDIALIEDCAHIMPDSSGPHQVATHGDALIFSFGRDKAISGITGGALIIRNRNLERGTCLPAGKAGNLELLPIGQIVRLLLYPLIYSIAKPLYGIKIGKAFLVLARKLGLLVAITTKKEKEGTMEKTLHSMPSACAHLALSQWKKLQTINDHRRTLTAFYLEKAKENGWQYCAAIEPNLPLQKFPLFVKDALTIRSKLKAQNIHLDDGWTGCVICPEGVDLSPTHYTPGSDPEAEKLCKQILSLPLHPTMTLRQAAHLVQSLETIHDNH